MPSMESGVTIRATIFIPSFEKNLLDTPQIIIRRENDVWLEVYYRNKVKKDATNDTCYISTFTEERRRYYEKAGMNADQIAHAEEHPCYRSDENCNYIITLSEIHYVRFRLGQKTKTYKLIVTD